MFRSFHRSATRSNGSRFACRAIRRTALSAALLVLVGCAQLSDWIEPSETPTQLSRAAVEVTEEDTAFPNLASVPDEAPAVTPSDVRHEVMEGLVADRANAEYTDQVLRAGGAPPPEAAERLPEIFSISPAAGSERLAAVDRGAPRPAEPDGQAEGGGADGQASPSAAEEPAPAPKPEVTPPPEIADVPPSPVPEVMQPAEPAPSPATTADAEAAAPDSPAPARPVLEPGGALGPITGPIAGPIAEEPADADAEVATLPPDERAPGGDAAAGLRVLFDEKSAELSAAAQSKLAALADRLLHNEVARVELAAYASGKDGAEDSSYARRLSLSRAIAVRRFLIEQGISSSRMDVRALGDQAEDQPADRVDVTLAAR